MIQELKIQNFLSFKDEVVFSFEATSDTTLEDYYVYEPVKGVRLLKMAMVYGANASGKSNLIEAFDFIHRFIFANVDNKDEELDFRAFAFDKTTKEPGKLELTFYVGTVKHLYSITIDRKNVFNETLLFYPGTQPAVIFERTLSGTGKTAILKFGNKIKVSKAALDEITVKTLKNISVFVGYSSVNVEIPEIEAVYEWFQYQFMNSINPYHSLTEYSDNHIQSNEELKKFALEFIQRADLNISDIYYEKEAKPVPEAVMEELDNLRISESEKERIRKEKVIEFDTTVFEHRIIKEDQEIYFKLPENEQSRGTMRYYGLSAPFYNAIKNNALMLIDEIGSGLHPLLIMHFLREFLKRSDSAQILFTTHNMSLLNEKDILRRDAIWITEKGEDGATELSSFADFSDFRKELSYYNYYKHGKFGGIPELK